MVLYKQCTILPKSHYHVLNIPTNDSHQSIYRHLDHPPQPSQIMYVVVKNVHRFGVRMDAKLCKQS